MNLATSPKVTANWLTPHMVELENLITIGSDLIEKTKDSELWKPALAGGQVSKVRTNDCLSIKKQNGFQEEENQLFKLVAHSILQYQEKHPSIHIRADSGYDLLRYAKGQYYERHIDNKLMNARYLNRQLSVVLYLNDDYEGGETYFHDHDIKHKGKAGSALIFPSTMCYPHESLMVTEGTKYVIVTWLLT